MTKGTVKFYNAQRGFGFIEPESGGKDVFVHASVLERAAISTVVEGQKVSRQDGRGQDRARLVLTRLKIKVVPFGRWLGCGGPRRKCLEPATVRKL
jgi:cold shock protein